MRTTLNLTLLKQYALFRKPILLLNLILEKLLTLELQWRAYIATVII
jgi:hypothetical protein